MLPARENSCSWVEDMGSVFRGLLAGVLVVCVVHSSGRTCGLNTSARVVYCTLYADDCGGLRPSNWWEGW